MELENIKFLKESLAMAIGQLVLDFEKETKTKVCSIYPKRDSNTLQEKISVTLEV